MAGTAPIPPPVEVSFDAPMSFAASRAVVRAFVRRRPLWKSILECAVFLSALVLASWWLYGERGIGGATLGYLMAWIWICHLRMRQMDRQMAALWTAPSYRLIVDDEGLLAASEGGSYWRAWNRVSNLLERDEWIAIAFDGLETLAIPNTSFKDAETRESWLGYVRAHIAQPA